MVLWKKSATSSLGLFALFTSQTHGQICSDEFSSNVTEHVVNDDGTIRLFASHGDNDCIVNIEDELHHKNCRERGD